MVERNARIVISIFLFFICFCAPAYARELPPGFGKARWGMKLEEVIKVYGLRLTPSASPEGNGPWAVIGPGPDELTASGAALGDDQVRSVSFGFHPEKGLGAVHVRLADALRSIPFAELLEKMEGEYGTPVRLERGVTMKAIWEDERTHLEFTYHRVSETRPTPRDHYALVVWDRSVADFSAEPHEKGTHPSLTPEGSPP